MTASPLAGRRPSPAAGPSTCDDPPTAADMGPYTRPHLGRTLLSLATSVLPVLALWVLMYFALSVSYLLVLALAVPAAGFMLRTFILFHDCAHGSLLRGRRANAWLGRFLGLMVFTPFARWRHEHAMHHATTADLDRRGRGDIHTLTVEEYDARSPMGRFGYRLFRNPIVLFVLGPIHGMLLAPRWIRPSARPQIRRSVWGTNLALVLAIAGMCWLVGWRAFVLVNVPLAGLAGAAGIWLFYVQHQFDHTYWKRSPEWSYADAALLGSSYLRFPRVLQFFTGNIGFHHVHHMSTKIPNYNLQRAHDENSIFGSVPALSLWDALRTARLKLWDEEASRLVTWKEHRQRAARSSKWAIQDSNL